MMRSIHTYLTYRHIADKRQAARQETLHTQTHTRNETCSAMCILSTVA